MNTQNKTMYGLDPSNYPSRMGQSWKEEEVVKLLRSIQKKKSIEEIAHEHERTVGGIASRIQTLAVEYHYNDKRPIEEIQKYTGLSKEQIVTAIAKHDIKQAIKKKPTEPRISLIEENIVVCEEKLPTMLEVVSLLKDIQYKLDLLLQRPSA